MPRLSNVAAAVLLAGGALLILIGTYRINEAAAVIVFGAFCVVAALDVSR